MTFKLYNPHTEKQHWKSVNVDGFKHDGMSCKSSAFVSPASKRFLLHSFRVSRRVVSSWVRSYTRPGRGPEAS